jgi:integrase
MGSRFGMATLTRKRSGAFQLRKRIPDDVRPEYQRRHGLWSEVKITIPAGTPLEKAKAIHAAELAKVEGRIAAIRAEQRGEGHDLTQRDAQALAGDWYRQFTSQHSDNPGSAMRWSSLRETLWDMASLAGDPETGEADFDDPEVLSGVDIETRASQFLADRGIALTQAAQTKFLSAVAREFLEATETLERYSRGDRSRDQHLDQLEPSPNLSPAVSPNGVHREAVTGGRTGRAQLSSAVEIFDASCKGRGIKPSTIIGQRCVFTALDKEDWRAPEWDAQQWMDSLVTDDRSPQTVRKWLATARAVFTWAIRKRAKDAEGRRLIETNPFKDCFIKVPKRPKLRETDRAFTEEEIQTILRASIALGDRPKKPLDEARRWVPWLCAYTGARGGEITQLRVQDIEQRTCGPVLHITPEAGTTKTGNARWVPLHPHLVEMGFPDYVAAVGARLGKHGPLFYRPQSKPSKKHPAVNVREQLSKWIRGKLKITDRGVQPLHGWRHTFKTRAMRAKIEERIRDEICGQVARGVAGQYEHPMIEDMAEALKQFPRYEVK